MSDLIARLEAATEGGRELDAVVWALVLPRSGVAFDGYGEPENFLRYEYDANEDGSVDLYVVFASGDRHSMRRAKRKSPNYTTSLDAAMTLMPEGWFASVMLFGEFFHATAFRPEWHSKEVLTDPRTIKAMNAPKPALALCIVLLKARDGSLP